MKLTQFSQMLIIVVTVLILSTGLYGCAKSQDNKDEEDYKNKYEQLLEEQPPQIKEIKFLTADGQTIEKRDNWIELQSKVKVVITLSGNSTGVDMYMAPTGTEAYKLQRLIDSVDPQNNTAEYIWEVPEGTMGHFWVIAYNKDAGRKSQSINVIRQD